MLDQETRLFWISAQRLRLTSHQRDADETDEALEDLAGIFVNTDSALLVQRCAQLLNKQNPQCASSA